MLCINAFKILLYQVIGGMNFEEIGNPFVFLTIYVTCYCGVRSGESRIHGSGL
jgi:hypothetical protein